MNPRQSTPTRVRGPRAVLLLHPFQVPITLALLVVAVVFLIFPEALEHTAVSFETRGPAHHLLFHYPLLFGAAFTLAGLLIEGGRVLMTDLTVAELLEITGLTLMMGAVAVNFIALIASGAELNGLVIAARCGMLAGFAVRLYILIVRPSVTVRAASDER